jgi:hypothetical protein
MRITELLLEYDRAITLQKFSSAIEPIATQEKLTAEQAIAALEQMDPTTNKQYVPWLAKQFISKQFKIEESGQVKELLTNFIKLKPRLPVEQRDLGRFDFHKLSEIINSIMNPKVGLTATSDAGIFPAVPDSEVLYNGPYGQLAIPETEEASCELGRGTKWCTSARKDNQFDSYNEDSPLYVWKDRDGSKWQFQFSALSFQFMDAKNDSIDDKKLKYFRTEHPVVKKLFKQKEKEIARDTYRSFLYAEHVIRGRWPEAEKAIARDPKIASMYAEKVIKGRWPEAESIILTNPNTASSYAANSIKGRWPEAESIILTNPQAIVMYAEKVIKGRWPEGESIILTNPQAIVVYAEKVIKGRWPEAEPVIAQDPKWAAEYALNSIKGRWPEGEPVIARDPNTAAMYKRNFGINLRQ